MDRRHLLVAACLLLAAAASDCLEVRAYFNTGGVGGYITYTATDLNAPGSQASGAVRLDTRMMTGYPSTGDLLWHIHENAFAPGTEDVCGGAQTGGPWDPDNRMANANYSVACTRNAWHECALGDLSGKLGVLLPRSFIDASSIKLIDLLGRSIVLHYANGTRFACANFLYSEAPATGACTNKPEPMVYAAWFVWPVSGYVILRSYYPSVPPAALNGRPIAVGLTARLQDVTGSNIQGGISFTGHGKAVPISESLIRATDVRCFDAGPALGNFTDYVGGEFLRIFQTSTDRPQVMPYSSDMLPHVKGTLKSIILWYNSQPLACATLTPINPTSASATLSSPVSGTLKYTQNSPTDVPARTVAIVNSAAQAGWLGLRSAPLVPSPGSTCSAAGQLYNPAGFMTSGLAVSANANLTGTFCDEARTLFGPTSILSRSVTIENTAQPQSTPLSCGWLREDNLPMGTRPVKATVQVGNGPVTGNLKIQQFALPDGTYTDSHMMLDLSSAAGTSVNHNAHIHINRVPPFPAGKSPCQAMYSGSHYNPFNVSTKPEPGYVAACGPTAQLRCEVGDLTGKIGRLTVDGMLRVSSAKMLPLEGPYSILGKSFVVHAANAGAERIACGNVIAEDSADGYVTYVTPSTPFNSSQFTSMLATTLNIMSSAVNFVTPFVDPDTRCTTISFNVHSSNASHSTWLANSAKTASLGQYSHQARCDPSANAAETLAHSLGMLAVFVITALLFS